MLENDANMKPVDKRVPYYQPVLAYLRQSAKAIRHRIGSQAHVTKQHQGVAPQNT